MAEITTSRTSLYYVQQPFMQAKVRKTTVYGSTCIDRTHFFLAFEVGVSLYEARVAAILVTSSIWLIPQDTYETYL